jgi:hypothetical protein
MSNWTVKDLLALADQARSEIRAGRLSVGAPVHISLEVIDDADERTIDHRVHAGSPVQVEVVQTVHQGCYVHMQFMGEPNWPVYPKCK